MKRQKLFQLADRYQILRYTYWITENNLVPIGCIGQIHIGGIQVARGYLNRPELTAENFIEDPFSKKPGCKNV